MLRTIKVYGPLKDFLGFSEIQANVNSVGEAIRFLTVNWEGLEKHMLEQFYKVNVGSWNISEEEINYPAGPDDPIQIIPVVEGAGAVGRILAGAALIALAVWNPAFLTIGTFSLQSVVGGIGLSLVLGGVIELLTPTPEVPEMESDPQLSFSFSGVQQTSRAGTAIPVIYGETLTGSVVISAAVEVSEVEST